MEITHLPEAEAPGAAAESLNLRHWGLRLVVYPLFFASGAAGLIYEVVWTRTLLSIFGAGLYAVCATLAAFMAGLALGSWALGGASDRLKRPLMLYAALEAAIGLAGAVMLPLLRHVDLVDGWAYLHLGGSVGVLTTFRFVLAFGLMLIPTTLMGATLPVLSRFLVRDSSHLGLHVGSLYSINTFGAVCGAFAAGYLLIGHFGLLSSELIAAGLNFAVAAGAALIALSVERPAPGAKKNPQSPIRNPQSMELLGASQCDVNWVLFTAFATGLVSLAAQVIWSRALVFNFEYLKNTTYTFSAMLTVFLAGLALGSALIGTVIDQQREPLRLYGILLTLIGMSMLFSILMLFFGADLLRIAEEYDIEKNHLNWVLAVGNVIMKTAGVLGIPTLLMGMAFPVAARVAVQLGRVGRDVGRLYSLNTIGAIAGSLLSGFVIIPLLGLTGGLFVLGCIDMALGVATVWRTRQTRAYSLAYTAFAVLMGLAVLYGISKKDGRGLQPVDSLVERQVFYKEGSLATVSVIENQLRDRMIYVDGVGVAGTDPIMQTDQKSLAHVPMCLLPNPGSALTVGFGSGGCSFSLLLHDRLKQVDCVEICPTMPEAAPTLGAANHLFFGKLNPIEFGKQDPRYDLILDDARAYLSYTDRKYDFISTDCTDLRYKSNANLYDLEYFQACRKRLTKDGIVVVWMPLAGLHRDVFKTALRTFNRVFPEMGVFFMDNEATHYILLIGWQDKIKLDYRLFAKTLAENDVRDDLGELYLDDPVKLLSCFITGGEPLRKYLAGDALNTENNPVIEFESPRYGYYDQPVIDNLNDLMAIRVSPLQFMEPGSIPPKEAERLARYEKALPLVIDGHARFRKVEIEKAAQDWMEAAKITPEDLSLTRNLLSFPIFQKRIQGEPGNYFNYLMLGRVNMMQGKLDYAYDLFNKAEAILADRMAHEPDPEFEKALKDVRKWQAEVKRQLQPAAEAPATAPEQAQAAPEAAPAAKPALPPVK